jgi:ASPM-SPD-2-Hydin domain-containing protein/galactose oxidase-like protein
MRASRFLIALLAIAPACFAQQPTWTPECPATSPPARYAHDVAYDTARGQVVLFGGADPSTNATFNDTWVWDVTNWTQKFPATSPPPKTAHAMAYDAARGQVVLFGGFTNGIPSADTWVWDGTNWTQKFPVTSPPISVFVGMTYDAIRQQVVLFGGGLYPNVLADTWVWDGVNWTQKFPATSPPPRIDHRLAFDATRGNVVLFGSWNGVTSLDDTWTWDGSNWTQQFPATSPASRFSYGIAYDAALQQIVLFGGEHCDDSNCGSQPGSPAPSFFNDTWTWDGTNWTQQLPATSPPTTTLPGMTYDEARSQIVLFGGSNGNSFVKSTWTYGAPASTTCPIGPPPTITSVFPQSGIQGQTIGNFMVNGNNFQPGATLSFSGDAGVHVNSTSVAPTQVSANVSIGVFSTSGPRDVIVTNPDGQIATRSGAFNVEVTPPPSAPNISVVPSSLDFGTVTPGTTTQTLTVFNGPNATAPLVVSSIASSNSAFQASSSSLPPLAPQASATVTVSLTMPPATPGTISGVLTFTSNAPTVSIPMKGTSNNADPLRMIAIQAPFSRFPLDMEALNARNNGNTIVTDLTIRNLTGTWYEVTLDVQNGFPVPGKFTSPVSYNPQQIPGLPCFYSATSIPCGFLIGPNETLTYPRDGTHLTFSAGQYLKLRATDLSFDQALAFALDALTRTLFGAQLKSSDLPASIFATLSSNVVKNVCLQNAVDMLNDVNNIPKTTSDMFSLLSCVVQNDQTMTAKIGSWLSANPQLFGAGAGDQWTKIISKNLDGYAFLVGSAVNVAEYLTPLVAAQLSAPSTGYILLGEPKP